MKHLFQDQDRGFSLMYAFSPFSHAKPCMGPLSTVPEPRTDAFPVLASSLPPSQPAFVASLAHAFYPSHNRDSLSIALSGTSAAANPAFSSNILLPSIGGLLSNRTYPSSFRSQTRATYPAFDSRHVPNHRRLFPTISACESAATKPSSLLKNPLAVYFECKRLLLSPTGTWTCHIVAVLSFAGDIIATNWDGGVVQPLGTHAPPPPSAGCSHTSYTMELDMTPLNRPASISATLTNAV